jgi:hypothetical protein
VCVDVFADIQICNVKPVCGRAVWPMGAPEAARRFYATNQVDTFLCDRPLHKPPIDKDNEFKVAALFLPPTITNYQPSLELIPFFATSNYSGL